MRCVGEELSFECFEVLFVFWYTRLRWLGMVVCIWIYAVYMFVYIHIYTPIVTCHIIPAIRQSSVPGKPQAAAWLFRGVRLSSFPLADCTYPLSLVYIKVWLWSSITPVRVIPTLPSHILRFQEQNRTKPATLRWNIIVRYSKNMCVSYVPKHIANRARRSN